MADGGSNKKELSEKLTVPHCLSRALLRLGEFDGGKRNAPIIR